MTTLDGRKWVTRNIKHKLDKADQMKCFFFAFMGLTCSDLWTRNLFFYSNKSISLWYKLCLSQRRRRWVRRATVAVKILSKSQAQCIDAENSRFLTSCVLLVIQWNVKALNRTLLFSAFDGLIAFYSLTQLFGYQSRFRQK